MAAKKDFPVVSVVDEMTKRLTRLEHCTVVIADIRRRHGYVRRQYLLQIFRERHGTSPSAFYRSMRESALVEAMKKDGNTIKARRKLYTRMPGLTAAGVDSALYRLGFPKPTPTNGKRPPLQRRQSNDLITIYDSNNRPQTRESLLRDLYR